MKNKSISSCLLAMAAAFLFSVCAAGCLATGWDLEMQAPLRILLWCGIFSAAMPVLLMPKYGILILLLLSVRGAFALWQDGELLREISALAYRISSHFGEVYGWSEIGGGTADSFDAVLILAAYPAALLASLCIMRNLSAAVGLAVPMLCLTVCLITTDTLPDEGYPAFLILGSALMLLTDAVRRERPGDGARLALALFLPAALCLGMFLHLNPQENYVNRAAELQKTAAEMYEKAKSAAGNVLSGNMAGESAAGTVNLKNIGPKNDFSYTVMRVTSPWDGVVYLRGKDYDLYTGDFWEASEREEMLMKGDPLAETGTLKVVTYGVRNAMALPYYPLKEITLTDGWAENTESAVGFGYIVSRMPAKNSGSTGETDWTGLPAETRKWALPLARKIISGKKTMGRREIAGKIEDYVKSSAAYDLKTPSMSGEYTDFAQWFLEESDTGYCVHFATAAVVLLRAAGIEARYVEGWMVSCEAEQKTLVSNQCAHAWAEYYDSDDGVWRILEATPPEAVIVGEPASGEDTEADETEPEESSADETEAETADPDEAGPGENAQGDDPGPLPDGTSHSGSPSGSGDSGSGNSGSGTSETNPSGKGNNALSSGRSPGDSHAERAPFVVPEWGKTAAGILLGILVSASVTVGQAYLRIAYRRRKRCAGEPNDMAVERYRQIRYLSRALRMPMPQDAEVLALRARFSQHTITRDELNRLEDFRIRILSAVWTMPWYRRLILFLIFAIA